MKVLKEYSDVGPVSTERHKVLQILINLVRNAGDACTRDPAGNKEITLRISSGDEFAGLKSVTMALASRRRI